MLTGVDNDQKILAEAFGLAIKVERVRRRLSQEELAHRAHLNVSYLSRTERGLSQPTLWTIYKLASALTLTPPQLVEMAMQNVDGEGVRPLSFEPSSGISDEKGRARSRR